MKKNIKFLSNKVLSLSLCLSMILSSQTVIFANENQTITIYHTNDILGSIDNLPNIKTLKDSTPNSLLLDAGNSTQGTALATYTKGKAIIDIMDATGYDVIGIGNHEFDFGQPTLIDNLKSASFVPLSANITNKDGKLFLSGINGNGANIIEEVNGKKIGIFGLTTPETSYKTNPKNITNLEFKNIIDTAKAQVDYLKSQNVDAIITISHLGDDITSNITSIDLAKQVPDIDIIIDGHTNTILQQRVNDTLISKTGSNLKNVGKITLDFSGDELKISSELLSLSDICENTKPDEKVANLIDSYETELNSILEKVIGYNDKNIYAFNQDIFCRREETPLGDLIADSMLSEAKSQLKNTEYENLPIVALENSGDIRANLNEGDITLKELYNILPFGNTITTKIVTPNILYTALENSVCKLSLDKNGNVIGLDGRFPQISGMRIEVDLSKQAYNPESPVSQPGKRIQAIYIKDKNNKEKLLDRTDTKTEIALVSNDFVVSGGDGYTCLTNLKTIAEGEVLNEILQKYIIENSKNGIFSYNSGKQRISILKPEYQPISLDNFLYLSQDKEVSLYADVPETTPPYWANESIYYFKALGIFKDTKNFYPNNTVTYGDFKLIIQKLLGLQNSNLENYGLLDGLDEPFKDNYKLKREDVGFIVGNIIKYYNINLPTIDVELNEDVSDFAKNNFQYLVNLGVLKGNGSKFNPKKYVTKAELSVILYNLTGLYVK